MKLDEALRIVDDALTGEIADKPTLQHARGLLGRVRDRNRTDLDLSYRQLAAKHAEKLDPHDQEG